MEPKRNLLIVTFKYHPIGISRISRKESILEPRTDDEFHVGWKSRGIANMVNMPVAIMPVTG